MFRKPSFTLLKRSRKRERNRLQSIHPVKLEIINPLIFKLEVNQQKKDPRKRRREAAADRTNILKNSWYTIYPCS